MDESVSEKLDSFHFILKQQIYKILQMDNIEIVCKTFSSNFLQFILQKRVTPNDVFWGNSM